MIINGNNGLLQEIYRRILENRESHNIITEKGKIFVWDQKCEESFNKLKELLTTTPILKITDLDKTSLYALMHATKVWVEY